MFVTSCGAGGVCSLSPVLLGMVFSSNMERWVEPVGKSIQRDWWKAADRARGSCYCLGNAQNTYFLHNRIIKSFGGLERKS